MHSYRRRVHRGVPESTASPDSVPDRNAASVATHIPPHQGRAFYMAGIQAIQRAEVARQAETGPAEIPAVGSQDSLLPGTDLQEKAGAHEDGPAQRQESSREDATAPIQAKIGFEFETGWLVDRIPFDYSHDDVEQPAQDPVPFKKMEVVTSRKFEGFRMEADEAEGGRSEIEFVIRPPIEENPDGLGTLDHVMTGMEDIAGRLVANRGDRASWPLSEVTQTPYDDFVLVTPRDETLSAGIQPTMGLQLEQVPEFYPHAEQVSDLPKYNGFLHLVRSYIVAGSQNETQDEYPLAYPKMLAEPLLARTNFVGLLDLVEPEALAGFHDAEAFVDGVLAAIGCTDLKTNLLIDRGVILGDQDIYSGRFLAKRLLEDQLVGDQAEYEQLDGEKIAARVNVDTIMERATDYFFGYTSNDKKRDLHIAQEAYLQLAQRQANAQLALHQLQVQIDNIGEELQRLIYKPDLTVETWLGGIYQRVDHLTALKDSESMGQFGTRTEEVGPQGVQGGVFEFRGMQKLKIPFNQWKTTAMDFFARILGLHGH